MVAGQLVRIGSTADGIPRAGHAPVTLQIKTALAGRLREAMREYNRVTRRVSVHSLPAQQQKDMVAPHCQHPKLPWSSHRLPKPWPRRKKGSQGGRRPTLGNAASSSPLWGGLAVQADQAQNLGRHPEQRPANAPHSEIREGQLAKAMEGRKRGGIGWTIPQACGKLPEGAVRQPK